MRWIDGVPEEADNTIVIHIADMIRNDINKIKLCTVDTAVIVILLAFMPQFLELFFTVSQVMIQLIVSLEKLKGYGLIISPV